MRRLAWIAGTTLTLLSFSLAGPAFGEQRTLLLATTTSVQDSGLLDALLPAFTETSTIRIRAVAVGTGAALRMGREGNADALLTHAPAAEQALVDDGSIDRRVEVMENYFVLVGPKDDPAGVRAAPSVIEALRLIRTTEAPFVSRADDSGTHKREVALFREAGLDPAATWSDLTRTGSGMGLSLQVAGQKEAYILSDIGTFLAFRERIGLEAMSGEEPSLRNVYSVLRVSKARHPAVHVTEADAFIVFMQSPATRARIADFGAKRFGRPLFVPLDGATGP